MLADHRAERGPWCSGYGVPAHYSDDLTLDHVLEISRGGSVTDRSNLRVLCRSCNTRKRHR